MEKSSANESGLPDNEHSSYIVFIQKKFGEHLYIPGSRVGTRDCKMNKIYPQEIAI